MRSPALTEEQLFSNGVVRLDKLAGRTLVGHIVGGIESLVPTPPWSAATGLPPSLASGCLKFG